MPVTVLEEREVTPLPKDSAPPTEPPVRVEGALADAPDPPCLRVHLLPFIATCRGSMRRWLTSFSIARRLQEHAHIAATLNQEWGDKRSGDKRSRSTQGGTTGRSGEVASDIIPLPDGKLESSYAFSPAFP